MPPPAQTDRRCQPHARSADRAVPRASWRFSCVPAAVWCRGEDLNLHSQGKRFLRPPRLPLSPPRQIVGRGWGLPVEPHNALRFRVLRPAEFHRVAAPMSAVRVSPALYGLTAGKGAPTGGGIHNRRRARAAMWIWQRRPLDAIPRFVSVASPARDRKRKIISGRAHFVVDCRSRVTYVGFVDSRGDATMSEDQIERAVERMVDAVDARFMRGGMSSTEYNSEMRKIDAWADERRAENAA